MTRYDWLPCLASSLSSALPSGDSGIMLAARIVVASGDLREGGKGRSRESNPGRQRFDRLSVAREARRGE